MKADNLINQETANNHYTEEQVREAIKMAREPGYWDSGRYWGELYSEDEIIDELNSDD